MNKLFPSVLLLALLCACSHKNETEPAPGQADTATADGGAGEAAQRAEEERNAAAADAAAQKLAARYTAALVPLLSGSFGGACQVARGPNRDTMQISAGGSQDRVEVSAAGIVSAPGFEHDLAKSADGLSITRLFDAGKPSTAIATAGGTAPDWSFAHNSADNDNVRLTAEGMAIGCDGKPGKALRDQPLWPLVADFVGAAGTALSCGSGGVARSEQPFKTDRNGLTVGTRNFAFGSGLAMEMVGTGGGKGMHYAVSYVDGNKLNLIVDGEGHIATLIAANADQVQLECTRVN